MTGDSRTPLPPAAVPTLTEVVQVAPPAAVVEGPAAELPALAPPALSVASLVSVPMPLHDAAEAPPPKVPTPEPIGVGESELVDRVLFGVQRQIDLMLEHRLREALAPSLARLVEGLVQDSRAELASTLRDLVTRAVSQELARLRGR